MSTRGDRCAYLEGSAYLLALRFFFAGGVAAGERSVGTVTAVDRVRLEVRGVEVGGALERFKDADGEAVPYWNFDRRPPKDGVADDGVVDEAPSVEASSGTVEVPVSCRDLFARVGGIVVVEDRINRKMIWTTLLCV